MTQSHDSYLSLCTLWSWSESIRNFCPFYCRNVYIYLRDNDPFGGIENGGACDDPLFFCDPLVFSLEQMSYDHSSYRLGNMFGWRILFPSSGACLCPYFCNAYHIFHGHTCFTCGSRFSQSIHGFHPCSMHTCFWRRWCSCRFISFPLTDHLHFPASVYHLLVMDCLLCFDTPINV